MTENALNWNSILAVGFLPARGSWMLDIVAVAMVLVTVALVVSIYLVRYRKMRNAHRALQVTMAAVLLLAVIAFEVDMRFITNWRELARPSPFFASGWVDRSLWVHLAFAIPTPFVWGFIIYGAWQNYGKSTPRPGFWANHRWQGRVGVGLMWMTALTGWFFYWIAFVA